MINTAQKLAALYPDVAEIVDLCAIAGRLDLAAGFMTSGLTGPQIARELLAALNASK